MKNSDIQDLIDTLVRFRRLESEVLTIGEEIKKTLYSGGKILTAGNGGSAADALHLAEELVGRFEKNRPAFPAICLAADPTLLTCILNDFGSDFIFSRQIEGIAKSGDILVVFSTSGESSNIISALKSANRCGIKTVALLGKSGGRAKDLAEKSIVVPSDNTARIQEVHTLILHCWLRQIESEIL